MKSVVKATLVGLALAAAAVQTPLLAQGCVMCRTTAALARQAGALNLGILALLVPPLGIMAGILILTIKRNR